MFNVLLNAMSGRVRRVIGVVVMLVAVGMFAGAIAATVVNLNLHINGVKTNATILDVQTHFSGTTQRRSYTYSDVIQFATRDGVQHQASIPGSSGDHVGNTVAVVYDPSDASTVEDASSVGGLWWVTSVVLLAFSLLFGWLGLRFWRSGR